MVPNEFSAQSPIPNPIIPDNPQSPIFNLIFYFFLIYKYNKFHKLMSGINYGDIILESLKKEYFYIEDKMLLSLSTIKEIFIDSYGSMMNIVQYTKEIEEKLSYFNETEFNLTTKFNDELSYIHRHIKYLNIAILLIIFFMLFNFICLLTFGCKKKVYVSDKMEIELENKMNK